MTATRVPGPADDGGTGTRIVTGNLLTMDPSQPVARAMAIRDGHIVAVGDPGTVADQVPTGTPVLDLGELTVLPGFIDSHHHLLWAGMAALRVDLSPATGIADLLERLRDWATANPDRPWVVSSEGWEVGDLAERRYPTRTELDWACPNRPVYLPRGGHAAVVNTKALELAGITIDTPDPDGGVIERDDRAQATGLLLEHARDLVGVLVPPPTIAERVEALEHAQRWCLRNGITRIVDPGLTIAETEAYQQAAATGRLLVRATLLGLVPSGPDAVRVAAEFLPLMRTGWNEQVRLAGLKVFVDGGGSLGTAWLHQEYPGRPGYHGERLIHQGDLDALYEFCFHQGIALGAHTVGNAAMDSALAAIARLGRTPALAAAGFSLIHAYLWPSEQTRTLAAELGVAVANQPGMYARFAEVLTERFGEADMLTASPLRSWLAAGVQVAGGSDAPITASNPLHGIWQAVTRFHIGLGRQLNPAECIGPAAALALYSTGAAEVALVDGEEGMLKAGCRADWVALSDNPLICPAEQLQHLHVHLTAIGGEIVHEAN